MPPRTRTKEALKKRKHDVAGSSRQPEEAARRSDVFPPGLRPLSHLNTDQLMRVQELRQKKVHGGYYFNYALLDRYGCRERVEELASRPYWNQLFGWRGDTYEPLIYEFVASLDVKEEIIDHEKPSIEFTLFGTKYNISVNQLGVYLGFYTPNDWSTPWYNHMEKDFYTDAWAERHWQEFTEDPQAQFRGMRPATSLIKCNAIKTIKLLLNLTVGGRHKMLHRVYRSDLFLLQTLRDNQPVNMGLVCKNWLHTQAGDKCPDIWVGPILTRLCEGLGLQEQLRGEKVKVSMAELGLKQLKRGYLTGGPEDEPQDQAPAQQDYGIPPQYPEVHNWATMRAFQYQLYTDMTANFNRRMDQQDEVLARQGEVMAGYDARLRSQSEILARQDERMARQDAWMAGQSEAIEQLRRLMESRFPPPSHDGGSSME